MMQLAIQQPGPLSAYRSTAVPGIPVPVPVKPAAPVAPVIATVHLVDFPTETVAYGTLERAADAAQRYNAVRPPESPALFPIVAQAIVGKRGTIRPRCTLAAIEVPKDLWESFSERCLHFGADPSRLLASLVLNHVTNSAPEKVVAVSKQIENWERGKRKLPALPTATGAESEVAP